MLGTGTAPTQLIYLLYLLYISQHRCRMRLHNFEKLQDYVEENGNTFLCLITHYTIRYILEWTMPSSIPLLWQQVQGSDQCHVPAVLPLALVPDIRWTGLYIRS
jgi:hypothetical protein